ncbi:outer membrane beta-barrel protein [Bradyrhizobium sp. NP1]|uniref:outer membrane protein n=1 Tax=Bradyrhizobium sp. NP1 TaxID=3049772 RepID=UPI0025A5719F|nr:outer membrane beta-barrel protein [Bradyrhizobium sp. NP1]WJR76789.1 outer membrane beta-barrel protein [Bradyrhizobium sp. NP1]
MKKISLLTAAAVMSISLTGVARAADLPQAPTYKAAPIVAPMMYNWSGFYLGANGGYGWSNQCVDLTAINGIGGIFAEGCKSAGGGAIGGQIGYRWQAGQWVFGLEAQGDWTNIRNSRVSLQNPANTFKSTLNGLGLFTGQLGYAMNEALFYVKGGAAVGSQNFGIYNTALGTGIAYADRTRWGGVVGVGFEYGFTPNWTVGIEYDYLWRVNDSNTWLTPSLAPAITSITANTRTDANLLTLRVNYKFGGPVVAKY